MFASVFVALAVLASSVNAVLYVTAPVATTSWAAGTQQTVSWQDDGTSPNLQAFGPAKVSLGVGNAITQTQLQTIVASVDVSTTASIMFTPDPTVGSNGAFYFIRFESISAKDPTQPQFPLLAFSAKFTLTGMTGTFNSTVQAEINGASTAPLGGPTASASTPAAASSAPAVTPAASSAASKSSSPSSGSASHSASSASSSASATGAAKSGAGTVVASGLAAVLGSVAAVVGAMAF